LEPEQVAALEKIGRQLLDPETSAAEVLGVSPEYIDSMITCAYLLYSRGRYDQAGTILKAVIELDNERYYPYLLIGEIALKRRHFEQAVACLRQADELSDEHPLVSARLGEALLRIDEVPAGLSYLHRAVQLSDDEKARYVRRARYLIYVVGDMMESDGEIPTDGPDPSASVG
jgi:tetratricopeptide (TPR) repeat protein